jgi:fatty acid desaturase
VKRRELEDKDSSRKPGDPRIHADRKPHRRSSFLVSAILDDLDLVWGALSAPCTWILIGFFGDLSLMLLLLVYLGLWYLIAGFVQHIWLIAALELKKRHQEKVDMQREGGWIDKTEEENDKLLKDMAKKKKPRNYLTF